MKMISLTEKEQKARIKFQKKHLKKCNSVTKLLVTNSGIGQVVEVMCMSCGKVKNITDYSVW